MHNLETADEESRKMKNNESHSRLLLNLPTNADHSQLKTHLHINHITHLGSINKFLTCFTSLNKPPKFPRTEGKKNQMSHLNELN